MRVGGETIPGTASVNPYFEGESLQNIAIVTLKQDAATPCANPNSYKKVDNGASIVGAFFEVRFLLQRQLQEKNIFEIKGPLNLV